MERPIVASVLTVIGGALILLGGLLVFVIGGIVSAFLGHFSSLWLVGLVVGAFTILMGILMMLVPPAHVVWGVLAIVFALVSIPFALGGFILGFILAVAGGTIAIRWRPPPQPQVITVEGKTVV